MASASVKEVAKRHPYIANHFKFPNFNRMQTESIQCILDSNRNVIVSAPTSAGKTVLFELAILKQMHIKPNSKCVYLAPIRCLCQQKTEQWKAAFKGTRISELTGDRYDTEENISQYQIVVATPEKLDSVTRQAFGNQVNFDLLMIDEIHMLNAEGRGATLEAVVNRFKRMPGTRTIAVSATIPNIHELAKWLKVETSHIKIFGEAYRPVNIDKVVLGYKENKNQFIFEKILNTHLPRVILDYSDSEPTLVFCQTQKGTVSACEALISALPKNFLVQSDDQLTTLIMKSKQLSNPTLRQFVSCGVSFHNASLTYTDRKIIEELFLARYIKIICTTSTLAMGVNLPAKLVVIKSTNCYRGSVRGYEEYTRAEVQQMMGRAGRVQFDVKGLAVIMTESYNVKKYEADPQLEPVQSQLLVQIKEHINAEIALRGIKSFDDCLQYYSDSFCYLRASKKMQNQKNAAGELNKVCIQSLNILNKYGFIRYDQQKGTITPLQLCQEVCKGYITIDSIITIIQNLHEILSLKSFLQVVCKCEQFKKYRSKLDERRCLKILNDQNTYKLKGTIATVELKAFVLVQALLSNIHIENWEMRKQASDMVYILRSLCFTLRKLLKDRQHFVGLVYSNIAIKYFTLSAWQENNEVLISQIPTMKNKHQCVMNMVKKTQKPQKPPLQLLQQLAESEQLSVICRQNLSFSQDNLKFLRNLKRVDVLARLQKTALWIKVQHTMQIPQSCNGINVVVGDRNNKLETVRFMNRKEKDIDIYLNKFVAPVFVALVFDRFIGFDRFFSVDGEAHVRRISEINLEKPTEPKEKPKRQFNSLQNNRTQALEVQHQRYTRFQSEQKNLAYPCSILRKNKDKQYPSEIRFLSTARSLSNYHNSSLQSLEKVSVEPHSKPIIGDLQMFEDVLQAKPEIKTLDYETKFQTQEASQNYSQPQQEMPPKMTNHNKASSTTNIVQEEPENKKQKKNKKALKVVEQRAERTPMQPNKSISKYMQSKPPQSLYSASYTRYLGGVKITKNSQCPFQQLLKLL